MPSELARVTQAVTVRVEQTSLVQGMDTAPLSPIPCVAVVRVFGVAAVCICRLSLMLLGGVLLVVALVAELLSPVLRAAGGAAIEASKGGCDCE